MKIILIILGDLIFKAFLIFIWVLCRACTLADEREGFEE